MSNPAGFWIRFGSRIIDALMIGIIIAVVLTVFSLDTQSRAVQFSESLISLLYFIVVPVLWLGYTVGKRVFSIRIVHKDGSQVSLLTMIMREFVAGLAYGLTLGLLVIVSAFMVGLREDKRAIHDLIAGTYVTHNSP